MRFVTLFALLFLMIGCSSAKINHQITMEDTPATKSTANVQPPNDTKATYLHPKSSTNVQTREDRFWVTYDPNNVVKDFGFAGPPIQKSTNAQP
jgi:hypothetical protein